MLMLETSWQMFKKLSQDQNSIQATLGNGTLQTSTYVKKTNTDCHLPSTHKIHHLQSIIFHVFRIGALAQLCCHSCNIPARGAQYCHQPKSNVCSGLQALVCACTCLCTAWMAQNTAATTPPIASVPCPSPLEPRLQNILPAFPNNLF